MNYSAIQRQSVSPTPLVLVNGADIDFNTSIALPNAANITYSGGIFTIEEAGVYVVDWFVVLQSAFTTSGPKFTLVATTPGTPATVIDYPSTSSFKTGTLSGSAVVEASAGTTLELQNKSGAEAVLASNIDVVANISIIRAIQQIQGVELQLKNASGGTLTNGGTVAYDTLYTNQSSVINNTAGTITISADGVYLFDWIVSLGGAIGSAAERNFELKKGAITVGMSVTPAVEQGAIVGHAIVPVTSGDTFTLVNTTGVNLKYDSISIQSFMRICSLK